MYRNDLEQVNNASPHLGEYVVAEVDATSKTRAQSQRGPGKPATMVPAYVMKDGKSFSFQVSFKSCFPFLFLVFR